MIFILYLSDVDASGNLPAQAKQSGERRGMDLPDSVVISEEGPREGFQIEPGPIATADKIALIDALSACGLRKIQVGFLRQSKTRSGVGRCRRPSWRDFPRGKASNILRCGSTYRACSGRWRSGISSRSPASFR
jgi:hypothetical protein